MVEPVSISLAAVALLQPAVQSIFQAYKAYKLTEAFGGDFWEYSRKYDCQHARLEEWLQWRIPFEPQKGDRFSTAVLNQLGIMEREFKYCKALMSKPKYQPKKGIHFAPR